MDIQKLITMGKLECDFDIDGTVFHMVTPTADEIEKVVSGTDLLTVCITQIDDRKFVEAKDKAELRNILGSAQGAIMGRVTIRLTDLITEQGTIVDNLPKK